MFFCAIYTKFHSKMNKLALGTVQFGMNYGLSNPNGVVGMEEVARIISVAGINGVKVLDTAVGYGDSERCLGSVGVESYRVITKLPPIPNVDDLEGWIMSTIKGSLARLKISKLEAVLLHSSADIIGPKASEYQAAMHALKERGFCNSVGVSIYSPNELDMIWDHRSQWRPDLIQAPLNVFDRRIASSGWLEKLSNENIKVHARSVFLQGLLLMAPKQIPDYFSRWRKLLDEWFGWCQSNNVTPLQAALGFVNYYDEVENIVVGALSAKQLMEICDGIFAKSPLPPVNLECNDLDLIEPPHWRIK